MTSPGRDVVASPSGEVELAVTPGELCYIASYLRDGRHQLSRERPPRRKRHSSVKQILNRITSVDRDIEEENPDFIDDDMDYPQSVQCLPNIPDHGRQQAIRIELCESHQSVMSASQSFVMRCVTQNADDISRRQEESRDAVLNSHDQVLNAINSFTASV